MAANFVPLLAPANPMSYDTEQFYNGALAIVAGVGAAARFISLDTAAVARISDPPVAGADVARSAPPRDGSDPADARRIGRAECTAGSRRCRIRPQPLQRSQLLAAFSVGTEIIQLRHIAFRLELDTALDDALKALAEGQSAIAVERLASVDQVLASRLVATAALRARGLILAISEALTQHAAYFDAGAPG